MRVLLVAPSQASLPKSVQEVESVVNSGLNVRLLQSSVSQSDLVKELSTPGKFDVLWFATHGGTEGIILTDDVLSPSAAVSIIRGSGVKLVFLNTCSSLSVASAIQNEANVDVICTITDVPDIEAYRTGALFAAKLVQTGNFRRSYELSKPGKNSTYIYLSSAGPLENGKSEFEQLRKTVDELESAARSRDKAEVHKKTSELNDLARRIDEHDGVIVGIKGEVKEVKDRVSTLEDHVFVPRSVLMWRLASAITVIIALAIFLIEDLNKRFLVTLPNGLLFESAIITLAIVFWYVGFLTSKQTGDEP